MSTAAVKYIHKKIIIRRIKLKYAHKIASMHSKNNNSNFVVGYFNEILFLTDIRRFRAMPGRDGAPNLSGAVPSAPFSKGKKYQFAFAAPFFQRLITSIAFFSWNAG